MPFVGGGPKTERSGSVLKMVGTSVTIEVPELSLHLQPLDDT